jgi:hypothetical protein
MRWLGAVALFGLAGCGPAPGLPAIVTAELNGLHTATTPPTAQLLSSEGPSRDHLTIHETWTLSLDQSWSAYRAWVAPRMSSLGYQPIDGNALAFSRQVEGDVYRVVVVQTGDPPSVQVRFNCGPD